MYDEYRFNSSKGETPMLWTIIVILIVLWLLGYFGPSIHARIPRSGNVIHTLLVIAVILIILNLAGVI
jgi:hypothetical protein